MAIANEEFVRWKNDDVTKEIFAAITNIRNQLNQAMTSADVVMVSDSDRRVARLLGQREGLDLILNIHFNDVATVDGVEEDEENTVGVQSSSESVE